MLFSRRKEPGPLGEMADSKAGIGKAQEVPRESHATKEERGKRVKGHRREREGLH